MDYIIQDGFTGYIWADTREREKRPKEDDLVGVIRAMGIVDPDLRYEEVSRLSGDAGFIIYEVPEGFMGIEDGQDRDTIDAVMQLPLAGYVEYKLSRVCP